MARHYIKSKRRTSFRRIAVCVTLCLTLCAGMVIQFHDHCHCDRCHLMHAVNYDSDAHEGHESHGCDLACGLHPTDYDLPQHPQFSFHDFSKDLSAANFLPADTARLQPDVIFPTTFHTYFIPTLSEGHHTVCCLRGPPCA